MELASYKNSAKRTLTDLGRRFEAICRPSRRGLLTAPQREIVDKLDKIGAVVTTLDAMGCGFDATCSRDIKTLFESIRISRDGRKTFKGGAPQSVLDYCTGITAWGLQAAQMDIVESYLRVPINYRGVYARLDMPDGDDTETRRWHIDSEDTRTVKFIVYLNDIGPDDGPYEFIPRRYTPSFRQSQYVDGRILDSTMEEAVSRDRWVACTGPATTVVITDTCRVWHRGRPPVRGMRKTLFFNYTTRRPMNPHYCSQVFDVDLFKKANPDLSSRQREAIDFPWRPDVSSKR